MAQSLSPALQSAALDTTITKEAFSMGLLYLIRHPHTQIDLNVPAQTWGLSDKGREQVADLLEAPFWEHVHTIYPSREFKAITAAKEAALRYEIPVIPRPALGEVDRTAYTAPDQEAYQAAVAAFFAQPEQNPFGWETAAAARQRFQRELDQIFSWHDADQSVAIITHGLVLTVAIAALRNQPSTLDDWQAIGFAAVAAVDRATMQPLTGFMTAPYAGLPRP
ncbi:histidine phosphatase family protein [Chloroflexota bacterium]